MIETMVRIENHPAKTGSVLSKSEPKINAMQRSAKVRENIYSLNSAFFGHFFAKKLLIKDLPFRAPFRYLF